MPMLTVASAHLTSMDLLTHAAVSPILASAAETGYTNSELKGSWLRVSRTLATSLLKGRIRMKSFNLHWLVVTGLVLATCFRVSAAIPPLSYDKQTPGAITNIGETFSYTLAVNAKDVLNFTVVATKSTSGTFGPCIILYDPLHNNVDSAGGSYNQDVEMNGYVALVTGTYEVSINDCANQATGDYEIFVQKSNAPIGALPLAYAAVKTGVINSIAESNAYTITANINDVLNFTVVATTSLSGTLGPCILLYNTTGNPLLALAGGINNSTCAHS
jgi:hypothetical protein